MTLALGIEIGGTKLQAGVGGPDGRLHSLQRDSITPSAGAEGIRSTLPKLIELALAQAQVSIDALQGIGVGFGGPVDSKNGVTLLSHQIAGWERFPLRHWLEDRYPCPATIQNDASLAGFAEAHAGAGQGKDRVFYITLGSGVGGGWILHGKMDEGQGLGAAEIGHTWVPDPETGEPEKLEHIASGWSIAQRAREALENGEPSMMRDLCDGDFDQLSAKTVYAAAEQDDLLARTLLDETSRTLAVAIGNIITLYHPEMVILGGGVSLMGRLFWQSLLEKIGGYVFTPFAQSFEVAPASLREEVVVVGGVLLGLQINSNPVDAP